MERKQLEVQQKTLTWNEQISDLHYKLFTTTAQLYNDLVLDGYDDWYLPSLVELNQLYIQKDIIGGFVNDWYWCSTKRDNNTCGGAWMQDFSDGRGFFFDKHVLS